jgi:predicted anti-sigma-YlaC factor YlaD
MEILNNVQLEGRRINVEISKMMVAEDVIITEEVLVVLVWRKSSAPRREVLHQEEKVQAVRSDRIQLQRRWFWKKIHSAQEEKVVFI